MMTKTHLLILFVTVCFYGCNKRTKAITSIDELFENGITLQSKHIDVGEHIWGVPMDILYGDSSLIVFDEKSEKGLFHLIDINHPDSVLNFGTKGQGQDELLMPFDFQRMGSNSFTVYDLYKKTLCRLAVPDIKKGRGQSLVATVKDSLAGTIKVLPTAFGTYVSMGFYQDCMFKLWGKSLTEVKNYGEYPYKDDNERRIANSLRGMAYQGFLRTRPELDRFVYATMASDILYFYQIGNADISLVKKYELNYPIYIPETDGDSSSAAISSDNKNTFISVSTSSNYVYFLYSGKSFKEDGMGALRGNIVYVFDWDGKAIRKYELDVLVSSISVDDRDKVLYAFTNMPDPELVRFELNE